MPSGFGECSNKELVLDWMLLGSRSTSVTQCLNQSYLEDRRNGGG